MVDMVTTQRRKLIEVALPLEAINREAAREKSIRHGHPATLHLWWARRPLAACRAVLFAQLVDDPSSHPELFPTEDEQDRERQRLFEIIERLVVWENSNDEQVFGDARAEIRRWCGDDLPPVLDPFCGGGSIPLEAQRLGLEVHASDLNPVAVLITKALIEIPPRWAERPPVHPRDDDQQLFERTTWQGSQGLAEDVRYYGRWMRDEAERRIGHLYPQATLPDGTQATVIAWLWARTVTCPNPACQTTMPLVRSFWLGKKKGKEAWVRPIPNPAKKRVRFEIGHGPEGPPVEGSVSRTGATCLVCGSPVPLAHVRVEGKAGRMGAQLMAIVAEGHRQRIYLPPRHEHERAADVPRPDVIPDTELAQDPRNIWCVNYGLTHHADLFTERQLSALSAFSDLVCEARDLVRKDATEILPGEEEAYADAIATYLALAVSRTADMLNSLVRWSTSRDQAVGLFGRQAIPMLWDYAEVAPFAQAAGDLAVTIESAAKAISGLPASREAQAYQSDAQLVHRGNSSVIATDPPYYDNVSYANLADFFYIWLRRSLREVHPDLFATLLTPKDAELIADPTRHGAKADELFQTGLERTFASLRQVQADGYPMTIFYAFRQSETDASGTVSTGWETMLEGLLRTGLAVTATWPVRSERGGRMRDIGSNALASSIVLTCRPRPATAGITDRQGFLRTLHDELPRALRDLQKGNIAPVDLAQAAIGPGMAVFSRYAKIVEPSGEPMRVRTALGLINQVLDQVLAEQENEFDAETRWAIKWFEQHGFDEGSYGTAETLFTATATSFDGLIAAGILDGRAGKIWLLAPADLPDDWDPASDTRVPVWEVTMHLIKRLNEQGEAAAADLLTRVGHIGDVARDLSYRLYNICERKGWAKEALAFNALVMAWPELARAAASTLAQPRLGVSS